MSGARFQQVIVRRAGLRTRFPDQFAARLRGRTVRALTRRGKYLLADLSSGDTLLMHLGMSGSFHVERPAGSAGTTVGGRAGDDADRHDHVVFRMSSGATITFNDPRRFGVMDLVPRGLLPQHPALSAMGPEPLAPAFDAAALARVVRRTEDGPEGRPARSARGRGPGQHLCVRGAPSCPVVAATASVPHRHAIGRAARRRRAAGECDQDDPAECDRPSDWWRLSIGAIPRLRSRRSAVPNATLRRDDQAIHASRPFDVLLPGLPDRLRCTKIPPTCSSISSTKWVDVAIAIDRMTAGLFSFAVAGYACDAGPQCGSLA